MICVLVGLGEVPGLTGCFLEEPCRPCWILSSVFPKNGRALEDVPPQLDHFSLRALGSSFSIQNRHSSVAVP